MAEHETVGARIRAARVGRKIKSAAYLADLVSDSGFPITRQSMANYESGKTNPRPAVVRGG